MRYIKFTSKLFFSMKTLNLVKSIKKLHFQYQISKIFLLQNSNYSNNNYEHLVPLYAACSDYVACAPPATCYSGMAYSRLFPHFYHLQVDVNVLSHTPQQDNPVFSMPILNLLRRSNLLFISIHTFIVLLQLHSPIHTLNLLLQL